MKTYTGHVEATIRIVIGDAFHTAVVSATPDNNPLGIHAGILELEGEERVVALLKVGVRAKASKGLTDVDLANSIALTPSPAAVILEPLIVKEEEPVTAA